MAPRRIQAAGTAEATSSRKPSGSKRYGASTLETPLTRLANLSTLSSLFDDSGADLDDSHADLVEDDLTRRVVQGEVARSSAFLSEEACRDVISKAATLAKQLLLARSCLNLTRKEGDSPAAVQVWCDKVEELEREARAAVLNVANFVPQFHRQQKQNLAMSNEMRASEARSSSLGGMLSLIQPERAALDATKTSASFAAAYKRRLQRVSTMWLWETNTRKIIEASSLSGASSNQSLTKKLQERVIVSESNEAAVASGRLPTRWKKSAPYLVCENVDKSNDFIATLWFDANERHVDQVHEELVRHVVDALDSQGASLVDITGAELPRNARRATDIWITGVHSARVARISCLYDWLGYKLDIRVPKAHQLACALKHAGAARIEVFPDALAHTRPSRRAAKEDEVTVQDPHDAEWVSLLSVAELLDRAEDVFEAQSFVLKSATSPTPEDRALLRRLRGAEILPVVYPKLTRWARLMAEESVNL